VRIYYRKGSLQDIDAIAQLLVQSWQHCYADFMPVEFLNSLSIRHQIQRHESYMKDKASYLIAENEHAELLGFASYGPNRLDSISCETEVYTLYVKQAQHGQGIGKALLNMIVADLEENINGLAVSVFSKNPFKHFYTKYGFAKVCEESIDMGSFALDGEVLCVEK